MINVRYCFALALLGLVACNGAAAPAATEAPAAAAPAPPPAAAPAPQHDDTPPLDPKNIVSIAIGSKDHTTLVAALKAADYVTAVSNPGPLTVFAPTNEAFAKLPAGTVENLVRPEQQSALQNILKYHCMTSAYPTTMLKDGMVLGMANGSKATIHVKDGKFSINDANIIASIPASNGIIHVIDGVLLPPAK
ncbi:MAG TPA: fasciclin domain-containing protein [Polyangiales bacterium]